LCKDVNFPPHQFHAEYQLPSFLQAFVPYPIPEYLPQPHTPTHVIYFKLVEDNSGKPEAEIFLCPAQKKISKILPSCIKGASEHNTKG
jgi:hypothetical protein